MVDAGHGCGLSFSKKMTDMMAREPQIKQRCKLLCRYSWPHATFMCGLYEYGLDARCLYLHQSASVCQSVR